jgi:hypothetical protein
MILLPDSHPEKGRSYPLKTNDASSVQTTLSLSLYPHIPKNLLL